ncbi:MAG: VWA domain-containing protein [Caldilineae bacterium]|nr:VWA domain-containing protein [Caldilineae bacterium]
MRRSDEVRRSIHRSAGLGRAPVLAALLLLAGAAFLALAPPARSGPAGEPAPLDRITGACLGDNPYLVSSQYVMGQMPAERALVAFHASPDQRSEQLGLALHGEIGSTWGLAYQPGLQAIFAGAFHKRASGFGPGGPGAIYRYDLGDGSVRLWAEVPDAGADIHGAFDGAGGFDLEGQDGAGRLALGDLDLSEDGSLLFAMNLSTRRIYRFRVADARLESSFAHGAVDQPWAEAEARPFGLKVWRGKLYHGLVRDASVSGDRADLDAYVYESALDGSGMREVLRFDLDYPWQGPHYEVEGKWMPWHHDHAETLDGRMFIWPQPWLTDIEFGQAGDMLLGLRDRHGDTVLFNVGGRLPPGEQNGQQGGDILIARPDGDRWVIDPDPEFFGQDASRGVGKTWDGHPETGFGGLARLRAPHEVVMSALSPLQYSSGGAEWFDVDSGANTRREELYAMREGINFGKANGLGDVEMLCAPPPTATPTASPTPEPIYLPFVRRDKYCRPDSYHTDVVLVLDRSTSMLRPVEPGGLAKNAAAIAAARDFVRLLALAPDPYGEHDQVAVVGFNDAAWVELGLGSDRGAALAALDRLERRTAEGTRLDLAFRTGQQPLDGPARRPENRPVIVLLTDGLPNRVPFGAGSPYPGSRRQEDSVLMAVDAVKQAGTQIYTVGLGSPRDILPWLLIDAASERWMYHYAPRPEDLAGIYARIAATFDSCEPRPAPTPCSPELQHADLVLVLDMSTSMARGTRGGRTKHAAAVAAARSFVDQLDLEPDGWGRRDQVAIVGFNGRAWTAIGLSDDRPAVEAALAGLEARIAEGTRLDLALAEGQRAFETGPRLLPNLPVMILLTDGLPNRVPFGPGSAEPGCPDQECTVLRAAERARQAGTRIYSIGLGLGDDLLRPLLEGIASDPSMVYVAPDGEDLEGIYRQIAGRLSSCP